MIPPDARQAIVRAFDSAIEETLSMSDVRIFLIKRISMLLASNMDLLMSALYRIDVYEHKVKAAFSNAPPDQLAEVLADLVIERQIQKIQIRQSYKDSNSNSLF